MRDIMNKFQEPLAKAANEIINYPNDRIREFTFYKIARNLGADLKPDVQVQADAVPLQADAVPVQADAVPVQPDVQVQADDVGASKSWWRFGFGGRKTARNHSRNHKRSRSRSRSRKQYKKLKRSSRSRRRR